MSAEEDQVRFCSNCARNIPLGNFTTHYEHCQRHLRLCPCCQEAVPLPALAEHVARHVPILPARQVDPIGPPRPIGLARARPTCRLCGLDTDPEDMTQHELYCGTRTEKCQECGEFVMMKYQGLHLESNHTFLKLDDEPGPVASWNQPQAKADSRNVRPIKRTNDSWQVNATPVRPTPKAAHKPAWPSEGGVSSPYAAATALLATLQLDGGELVALPCEFCGAMVPANQLLRHETACLETRTEDVAAVCTTSAREQHLLVNRLGLPSRRKVMNTEKPVANINPIPSVSASTSPAICNSQLQSTGAVPKQKAGNVLRTLQQEVSCTSTTSTPSVTAANEVRCKPRT